MKGIFKRAMGAALCLAAMATGAAADVVGTEGMYGDQYIHRILAPNGQELYYTAKEKDEWMQIKDVNFDGVDDIVVTTALGAGNAFYAFFVWDGEKYVRATYNAGEDTGIANYELYPELGLVYAGSSDGFAGALHHRYLYRWEGAELLCMRMAIAEEHTQWDFDSASGVTLATQDGRIHARVLEPVYSETDGRRDEVLWEEIVTLEDYERLEIQKQEDEMLWSSLR